MHFKFNINLTDKDYLDYNTFWMFKSPYGKRQILMLRIFLALLCVAVALLFLFSGGFSADAFINVIPYIILLILFQLFLNPFFKWILKGHIKSLKKKGKMGYSPLAEVTFYDERLVETTETNKIEHKYTAVERISVIPNKVIYIHVNNVMSYILPDACFASKTQFEDFIAFMKTKCAEINIY